MFEPKSQNRSARCVRGGVALVVAAVLAAACTAGSSPSAASPLALPTASDSNRASPSPSPSITELPAPRPGIIWKPIPFPHSRKQEMLAYAGRHYGLNTFKLVHPQVIVEQSDQDILGSPPQLSAALNLTLWLMQRFNIELRNVIGHNESLTSPLHKELVASFRCQTHQDWNHADMELFRQRLSRLAARFSVPLGPSATPVESGC